MLSRLIAAGGPRKARIHSTAHPSTPPIQQALCAPSGASVSAAPQALCVVSHMIRNGALASIEARLASQRTLRAKAS